jgi:hypothetical protein
VGRLSSGIVLDTLKTKDPYHSFPYSIEKRLARNRKEVQRTWTVEIRMSELDTTASESTAVPVWLEGTTVQVLYSMMSLSLGFKAQVQQFRLAARTGAGLRLSVVQLRRARRPFGAATTVDPGPLAGESRGSVQWRWRLTTRSTSSSSSPAPRSRA